MADVIVINTTLLRERSKLTSWAECKEKNLFERLKVATGTAWCKGSGLAAIQIGERLRAAWYVWEGKEHCLVNPRILKTAGRIVTKEGCLSIPNTWIQTERWGRLLISEESEYGVDIQREVRDYEALVVQHEIDHMDGILMLQRAAISHVDIGRNDPCFCGSGKKYKRCCINKPPEVKNP
jgi:peptide deformylase